MSNENFILLEFQILKDLINYLKEHNIAFQIVLIYRDFDDWFFSRYVERQFRERVNFKRFFENEKYKLSILFDNIDFIKNNVENLKIIKFNEVSNYIENLGIYNISKPNNRKKTENHVLIMKTQFNLPSKIYFKLTNLLRVKGLNMYIFDLIFYRFFKFKKTISISKIVDYPEDYSDYRVNYMKSFEALL